MTTGRTENKFPFKSLKICSKVLSLLEIRSSRRGLSGEGGLVEMGLLDKLACQRGGAYQSVGLIRNLKL